MPFNLLYGGVITGNLFHREKIRRHRILQL